jgi:hypothetical protein
MGCGMPDDTRLDGPRRARPTATRTSRSARCLRCDDRLSIARHLHDDSLSIARRQSIDKQGEVLGRPKRCKWPHACTWDHSWKRLAFPFVL